MAENTKDKQNEKNTGGKRHVSPAMVLAYVNALAAQNPQRWILCPKELLTSANPKSIKTLLEFLVKENFFVSVSAILRAAFEWNQIESTAPSKPKYSPNEVKAPSVSGEAVQPFANTSTTTHQASFSRDLSATPKAAETQIGPTANLEALRSVLQSCMIRQASTETTRDRDAGRHTTQGVEKILSALQKQGNNNGGLTHMQLKMLADQAMQSVIPRPRGEELLADVPPGNLLETQIPQVLVAPNSFEDNELFAKQESLIDAAAAPVCSLFTSYSARESPTTAPSRKPDQDARKRLQYYIGESKIGENDTQNFAHHIQLKFKFLMATLESHYGRRYNIKDTTKIFSFLADEFLNRVKLLVQDMHYWRNLGAAPTEKDLINTTNSANPKITTCWDNVLAFMERKTQDENDLIKFANKQDKRRQRAIKGRLQSTKSSRKSSERAQETPNTMYRERYEEDIGTPLDYQPVDSVSAFTRAQEFVEVAAAQKDCVHHVNSFHLRRSLENSPLAAKIFPAHFRFRAQRLVAAMHYDHEPTPPFVANPDCPPRDMFPPGPSLIFRLHKD